MQADELTDLWHTLGATVRQKDHRAQNVLLDILAASTEQGRVVHTDRQQDLLMEVLQDAKQLQSNCKLV